MTMEKINQDIQPQKISKAQKQYFIRLISGAEDFVIAEAPCNLQALLLSATPYCRLKNFYNQYFDFVFEYVKNNYVWQFISLRDLKKVGSYLMANLEKEDFLNEKIQNYKRDVDQFFEYYRQIRQLNFKKLEDEELADIFTQFLYKTSRTLNYPMILEAFSFYLEKIYFPSIICKINVGKTWDILNALSIISSPAKPPVFVDERIGFLNLVLEVLQKGLKKDVMQNTIKDLEQINPNFYKKIIKHHEQFSWLLSASHAIYHEIKPGDYLTLLKKEIKTKTAHEISEELKKTKSKISKNLADRRMVFKTLKAPKKIKTQLKQFGLISWWWDYKKGPQLLGIQFLLYISKFIAERLKCTPSQILLLTPEEVVLALKTGRKIDNANLDKRKTSLHVFSGKNGEIYCILGQEASNISKLLFSFREKLTKNNLEVKGIVGSKGPKKKFKGIARIVLDPHKDCLNDGEILITPMTRPDFLPIIKKASAVIADEGGIIAHTSILCRELKIPCIVGTRVATEIFKNGDLIEVDTDKGIVRKIDV